jgi:hypothetical protein
VLPHSTTLERCSESFCSNHNMREASIPTRGGDAFGDKLVMYGHMFSSSGLNLTHERLLLWASRRPQGDGPKRLHPREVES